MRTDILPGANVVVRVDGRKLKEYDVERSEDDAPNATVRYIEARTGAYFSIDLALGCYFPYKEDHLSFSVTVDGKHVRAIILAVDRHRSSSIKGLVNSTAAGSTIRRLTFAELIKKQTADHAIRPTAENALGSLGEIKVKLTRCRKISTGPDRKERTFVSPASAGVPEKALKGRAKVAGITNMSPSSTHMVETRPPSTYFGIAHAVSVTSPVGTDVRLHSADDLQSEGILERSPTPVPLEDREPDTLTLEEGRELARRNKIERDRQVAVKKEG
ncbi:hypothetical protein LTR95_014669 [Oleoguttula sp. CCFEE 5521]